MGMFGFLLQTYSQLAHPIQQAKALGLQFHSRVLDIDNIDVSASSRVGGRGRGASLNCAQLGGVSSLSLEE